MNTLTPDLIVYKGRTNVITANLGIDVSGDTITSEIRAEEDSSSTLIATWAVTFATNGVDGEVILTLDNSVVNAIVQSNGFMDMKRVSGGEPKPVFNKPIKVVFQRTVTA